MEYYKLTYEPSAKVSLKCVVFSSFEIWRFNRHVNIEHKQIPKIYIIFHDYIEEVYVSLF